MKSILKCILNTIFIPVGLGLAGIYSLARSLDDKLNVEIDYKYIIFHAGDIVVNF